MHCYYCKLTGESDIGVRHHFFLSGRASFVCCQAPISHAWPLQVLQCLWLCLCVGEVAPRKRSISDPNHFHTISTIPLVDASVWSHFRITLGDASLSLLIFWWQQHWTNLKLLNWTDEACIALHCIASMCAGGDHVPRATAPRVPDPAACPGRHLVPGRRCRLAVGGAGHVSS